MKKIKTLVLSLLFALVGAVFVMPFGSYSTNGADVELVKISNPNTFVSVMSNESNFSKYIMLTDDIDLSETDLSTVWENTATFTGTFDGNGYAIKNLTISSKSSYYGLFSRANGAVIKNLKIGGNINYKIVDGNIAQLYVGVLLGYGDNVEILNCEIGENSNGNLSQIRSLPEEDEEPGFVNSNTKFTFGNVAGSLIDGSTVNNCVVYTDGAFSSRLSAPSPMKIGGIAGVIDNSMILNCATFSRYKVTTISQHITVYHGGIVGEVQGDMSEVINTISESTITGAEGNQATILKGGVAGSVFSTYLESGKISFNYWVNKQISAFGENYNYIILDESVVKAVDAFNNVFMKETNNWHPLKYTGDTSGWDFDLTWNYLDSKLHLQTFQYFQYSFASDIDEDGVLEATNCRFDKADGLYKYGDPVTISLVYSPEFYGYYSLNEIQLTSNEIELPQDNITPVLNNNLVAGYEVILTASDATDGMYSFDFSPISFNNCEAVVYQEEGDTEERGGVRFFGGSTYTKQLSIPNLSIESDPVTIEAVEIGRFNLQKWELYVQNETGEFVKDESFVSTAPSITLDFGEDEHFKKTFRLVAYFTDELAIDVDFVGYDTTVITEIRFNDEVYTTEFPIKVSSTDNSVELVIIVKEGYILDVDAFIAFMKRKYGGDNTSLLNNYSITPAEDGSSVYRFSYINMASIQKGLGESKKINIELHASEKPVDNDKNLTWLWITLSIVGVLAIGGGLIAFFVIRRRNMMRRLGGDGHHDNSTKSKVKKTKAKEVDYKDYYS